MLLAYQLASQCLPAYRNNFSRRDFTLPQLVACLALREHQKKSYRGTEALLRDCPDLRAAIGLKNAPDHNTLCAAFKYIVTRRHMNKMLDVAVAWANRLGLVRGRVKPTALDSSYFESRHVSRHFEKRRAQTERQQRKKAAKAAKIEANRRRSRIVKRLPKLSLAVASASHIILAARATTGAGGDQPFFGPLLLDARRRANIRIAVADAGYDSEANHCLARLQLGIRSIIPPGTGRPTTKAPPTRFRALMKQRFARKADQRHYGQRWQVETVNSMLKRNFGSALRAKTARRRSLELLLRAVTHNIMILANVEG